MKSRMANIEYKEIYCKHGASPQRFAFEFESAKDCDEPATVTRISLCYRCYAMLKGLVLQEFVNNAISNVVVHSL